MFSPALALTLEVISANYVPQAILKFRKCRAASYKAVKDGKERSLTT